MSLYRIEPGASHQAERLRVIERASGIHFRNIGMADVADHDATSAAILESRAKEGRLYVALAPSKEIAGFLIWSPKDGQAHIEQLSVHPDHGGHRLGAQMIESLAATVRGRHPAMTLSTFRDVPWNAPYYASLGFVELQRDAAGPDHAIVWQEQSAIGLDMSKRLFMIRAL